MRPPPPPVVLCGGGPRSGCRVIQLGGGQRAAVEVAAAAATQHEHPAIGKQHRGGVGPNLEHRPGGGPLSVARVEDLGRGQDVRKSLRRSNADAPHHQHATIKQLRGGVVVARLDQAPGRGPRGLPDLFGGSGSAPTRQTRRPRDWGLATRRPTAARSRPIRRRPPPKSRGWRPTPQPGGAAAVTIARADAAQPAGPHRGDLRRPDRRRPGPACAAIRSKRSSSFIGLSPGTPDGTCRGRGPGVRPWRLRSSRCCARPRAH